MLLDNGLYYAYRPDRARGIRTPVDGLSAIFRDWYGLRNAESGKGAEAGDVIRRIRINDVDVRDNDIVRIDGQYWQVTRVYHGNDDETGLPIADVTLATGARYFVRIALLPRLVATDELNTLTGLPDTENPIDVWGNIGSVNADEYYTAEQVGHSLDMRVQVYSVDYNDEPYVLYNGVTYTVRRKEQRGNMIDLSCEAMTPWRE